MSTMTETAVETETAPAVVTMIRGTAGDSPATFARKVRNVALYASDDQTSPAIRAVHIVADGSRTIILVATDRYGLAEETVQLEAPVAPFAPFAALVDVKALLAAVKQLVPGKNAWALTLRPSADALTLDNGEGSTVRLPLVDGQFPRTASLWPGVLDDSREGVTSYGLSRFQLARLGKIDTGNRSTVSGVADPVRFTFQTARKPVVAHIGETFRALIMSVRIDGG